MCPIGIVRVALRAAPTRSPRSCDPLSALTAALRTPRSRPRSCTPPAVLPPPPSPPALQQHSVRRSRSRVRALRTPALAPACVTHTITSGLRATTALSQLAWPTACPGSGIERAAHTIATSGGPRATTGLSPRRCGRPPWQQRRARRSQDLLRHHRRSHCRDRQRPCVPDRLRARTRSRTALIAASLATAWL